VDLARGEQQKNVDWAFLESLRTMGVQSNQGVLLFYDIACQYCIYLESQIGHLLQTRLEIDWAIRSFHVQDHTIIAVFGNYTFLCSPLHQNYSEDIVKNTFLYWQD
jgi:hypothetical protein